MCRVVEQQAGQPAGRTGGGNARSKLRQFFALDVRMRGAVRSESLGFIEAEGDFRNLSNRIESGRNRLGSLAEI